MQNTLHIPKMGINADGLMSAQTGAPCASDVSPYQAHKCHQRCRFGDNPPVVYQEGTGALGGCSCNPMCFPQEQPLHADMNGFPK